jgi:farnesyl diphosphate synthase
MKTGALIRAAVRMGALCGDALDQGSLGCLDRFAWFTGLLFQIIDDLLDAEQDSSTLGKTAGKDAQQGKATYVSLMGLEAARQRARDAEREALECLANFGEGANRLRQLCRFIGQRGH